MRAHLVKVAFLVGCYELLSGFILETKQGAKLPMEPGGTPIQFVWDGAFPTFTDKNTYQGGALFGGLSDHDTMAKIITMAMDNWNNVPGSYLQYTYVENAAQAQISSTDKVNSIVIMKMGSASEGGLAIPTVGSDGSIDDCDIEVPPDSSPVAIMIHVLTHEFGHCLGLGHAHTNYNAIMGYAGSQNQIHLGADDMSGVIYLYPDPNDPENRKMQELIPLCGTIGGGSLGWTAGWRYGLLFVLLLPMALPGCCLAVGRIRVKITSRRRER